MGGILALKYLSCVSEVCGTFWLHKSIGIKGRGRG